LYGKNPPAKTNIAIGMRIFAARRQNVEIREAILLNFKPGRLTRVSSILGFDFWDMLPRGTTQWPLLPFVVFSRS
jgi:hypothetical protein